MNGHQRIKNVIEGKFPDKRPVMLHNFMHAAREDNLTMEQYRSDPDKAAFAHIHAVEKYNYDGILFDIDTATLAQAVGVPVDYPVDEPARCNGIFLNSLEMINDLSPVDISRNDHIQCWLEACRIIKKYFGDEIYVRGNCDQAPFSLASMMRTPENWMIDLLTEEEYTVKLLDYCSDVCLQFIKLMAETGVDMISNGDSPAGPDMISPELYKNFALPYEKKLVELSHQLGLPYTLHICGNTEAILDLMKETDAEAFELDYKTDMKKAFKSFKDKHTLIGNIDPSGVITFGSKALVQQKVTELLDVYKDSPGIIVNAGCAIPPNAPSENIKVLVDTVHNYTL